MQPASSAPLSNNDLLLSRGYGYIPRAVMLDRALTVTAKALYAYLCSFAGRGGAAWPAVERICADLCLGREAYYSAMRALRAMGYVRVRSEKRGGRFARNVYTLAAPGEPHADGPHAEEPRTEGPRPEQAQPGQPPPACPDTTNRIPSNNTSNDNPSDLEDEETPSVRARPRERPDCEAVPEAARKELERRRVAEMLPGMGGLPCRQDRLREARRAAVEAGFAGCYGRPPLAAEADVLAEQLLRCDMGALLRLIRVSAEHTPAAPAPYVRRMVDRCRSDAAAFRLIVRPSELLTEAVLDAVDERNRADGAWAR